MNNLVNQAAIRAAVESDPYVTMRHLEWAKDKIIMGEFSAAVNNFVKICLYLRPPNWPSMWRRDTNCPLNGLDCLRLFST